MQVILTDRSTHPQIGSWVWGEQGICYRVTRRFKESGQFFIVVSTGQGDRSLPLISVVGWCNAPQVGQQIVSDTGKLATITGFDPSLGMYAVEGDRIIGWLYPDQFEVVETMELKAA